jgi:3,4-dihydroxyphenylacetate 2,3-dioxygenase
MGQIAAAAVVSHVPTIMAPEDVRLSIGRGQDTSLVGGFTSLRQGLDTAGVDTLVIFDTHWFSTGDHVVAGGTTYRGIFTSSELPLLLSDLPYDYPGAPELARTIQDVAKERGVHVVNATSPHLPVHYPTLNLLHYLHRGEPVLSVSVCQTAERHNFLEFGGVLHEAIRRLDIRAALLAAGGMSHRFWPMDELPAHRTFDPAHVRTPEARAMDERILDLWAHGDHATVIDVYPEYRQYDPEGFFGHYLMMIGALGGPQCTAKGTLMSAYENAAGTGQVHVWFDLATQAG